MVVFGLPPKPLEAQTETPPIGVETDTPTPTDTPYFLIGGTQTITPTAVANGACPVGEWSPDDLHPDWAAVCSACLPEEEEDPIVAAASTITIPAVTIPAIFFGEYTLLEPTVTAAPTNTIAPSSTPSTWSHTWDFTASDGGWDHTNTTYNPYYGTYSAGVGWVHSDVRVGASNWSRGVQISYDFGAPVAITSISMIFQRTAGSIPGGNVWWSITGTGVNVSQSSSPSEAGLLTKSWSGSATTQDVLVMVRSSALTSASWSGEVTLREITITGVNTNPFSATATPTPTQTFTPSPTSPFSDGLFSLPPQDCTTPVYVSHEALADVGIEVGSEKACYTIFPQITLPDEVNLLGFEFTLPGFNVPRIDICLRFFYLTLALAGVQIDVLMLFAVPVFAFVLRWMLFN